MGSISIQRVEKIVTEAVRNGGTVYVPSPKFSLETNHGYGGLDSNPDNVTGLVNVLHSAAEYWLNMGSEAERTKEQEIGRLENWISEQAREWAMEHAS